MCIPFFVSVRNFSRFRRVSSRCEAKVGRTSLHRGETRRNRLKFRRHTGRNTQDFRSVYFTLYSVIPPKFGSLFYCHNPIQTLIWHPVAWVSCAKTITSSTKFTGPTFSHPGIFHNYSLLALPWKGFPISCLYFLLIHLILSCQVSALWTVWHFACVHIFFRFSRPH